MNTFFRPKRSANTPPRRAPISAPIYAVCEGLFLGGITAIFDRSYPGIAIQAVSLTFAVMFVMLLAYKSGIIRATRGFKLGVIAATGGIALVYLVNMVMSLFFHTQMSFLYSSTPVGIGISLFIVVVAALNLIIDFDMIENAARVGAPKYMEWYGAFGLMVTLIWLYLEILRFCPHRTDNQLQYFGPPRSQGREGRRVVPVEGQDWKQGRDSPNGPPSEPAVRAPRSATRQPRRRVA